MGNIVPRLQDGRSYVFCPKCQQENNRVELKRDMHLFTCTFGHTYQLAQLQAMIKAGTALEMVRTEIIEQPSPHAIKQSIWVTPQTWEAFQQKFHGRVLTTIGTVLDCLVNDSVLFIDGEAAQKLRKRGLTNGASIVAALEGMDRAEQERTEAIGQLERFQAILQAAGVSAVT